MIFLTKEKYNVIKVGQISIDSKMSDKVISNYQDLIKIIAIFAMIIDHIGLYLFPEYQVMRLIGRFAMPVFCFFAGYNFKNRPNHLILLYGLLSYIIHSILFIDFSYINILVSIYLGQCYLFIFHNQLKHFLYICCIHVVILVILWNITKDLFDYGSIAIAIMVLGYVAKHDHKHYKITIFFAILLQVAHTLVVFTLLSNYMVILLGIVEYLVIIFRDCNYRINFNLQVISRNALFIYFVHLTIIELILYLKIIAFFD